MITQKEKILELLERQPAGVSNFQLNSEVCFRYGARLKELRDEGYDIKTLKGQKKSEFIFKLIPKGGQLEMFA